MSEERIKFLEETVACYEEMVTKLQDQNFRILNKLDEYVLEEPTEPPEVTHEQIMTLWWKDNAGYWSQTGVYDRERKMYGVGWIDYLEKKTHEVFWAKKDWFKGRESAILPPEVE